MEELGTERVELTIRIPFEPVKSENSIRGLVNHIDTYENLITNIPEALFREVVKNNDFQISMRSVKLNAIHNSYGDVRPGEIVALFASHGLLEIAINKGNAASLLGINKKDPVLIEIFKG